MRWYEMLGSFGRSYQFLAQVPVLLNPLEVVRAISILFDIEENGPLYE